jgi:hypothetical protein
MSGPLLLCLILFWFDVIYLILIYISVSSMYVRSIYNVYLVWVCLLVVLVGLILTGIVLWEAEHLYTQCLVLFEVCNIFFSVASILECTKSPVIDV